MTTAHAREAAAARRDQMKMIRASWIAHRAEGHRYARRKMKRASRLRREASRAMWHRVTAAHRIAGQQVADALRGFGRAVGDLQALYQRQFAVALGGQADG